MRYDPDHRGMARLLINPQMDDPLLAIAVEALAYARRISPEETGVYKESFDVRTEIQGDRRAVILVNTAPYASFVEWGGNNSDGQHILAQTADWVEAETTSWARR